MRHDDVHALGTSEAQTLPMSGGGLGVWCAVIYC